MIRSSASASKVVVRGVVVCHGIVAGTGEPDSVVALRDSITYHLVVGKADGNSRATSGGIQILDGDT